MTQRAGTSFGSLLPAVSTEPPGQRSRALARKLRSFESRNVTFVGERWPVFWEEASGANVRDADGNVYLDLSAGFGVALLGHAHPAVVSAITAQADRLVHGMGDVHPPSLKVTLLERLCALGPWPTTRAVLASTGSEAVEIALKTAKVATGKPGVLALEGAYHGLTLGALAATSRAHFRAPFEERLYGGVAFAPFPDVLRDGRSAGRRALECIAGLLGTGAANGDAIGAIIVEPVQGRAGARVAPHGFFPELCELAARAGALVVADEVLTGAGRCGALLASERVQLRPDLVCVGKALGGGMPVSACLGRADVMDAWPASEGEAIHTSTFLGHPIACAAALAVLDALEHEAVVERVRVLGSRLVRRLRKELDGAPGVAEVRGLGLLIGIELVEADGRTPSAGRAVRVAEHALAEGLIVLPAGEFGHVVQLTPPANLTDEQASHATERLAWLIRGAA